MASPRSDPPSVDPPSPKLQKTEDVDSDSDDSDIGTAEEIQQFYDEFEKSQGFEMDFTKFTFCFDWEQVDLEDDLWVEKDKPEQKTNRDLLAMLCNVALTKHNTERGTKLKLSKVLRANFHPSAAVTFYISFEVNDGDQTIPYRAVVAYYPGRILVGSCDPRPSS